MVTVSGTGMVTAAAAVMFAVMVAAIAMVTLTVTVTAVVTAGLFMKVKQSRVFRF